MVRNVKNEFAEKFRGLGKKYRYPVLILALGLILMLIPVGKDGKSTVENVQAVLPDTVTGEFDLSSFTEKTELILSEIHGAGQVRVLFTLETDGASTYLADETSRQNGDDVERQTQTVLTRQSGDDVPVSVTKSFPVFRGALVVCQGAQDPNVILGIKEAISSLTGLGMDKITVLKMD